MKCVKIEHHRCDEYAATTYVWVADDMTEDELDALVDLARTNYLKNEQDFKNNPLAPLFPGYQPQYDRFPNLTVDEVKANHAVKKAEWDAYEEKRRAARKSFAHLLVDAGKGRIEFFWDGEFAIKADVYWGHQHGVQIDMGETDTDAKDFNARQENEEAL